MPFLLLEMDTIKRTASQNFYPTNIYVFTKKLFNYFYVIHVKIILTQIAA